MNNNSGIDAGCIPDSIYGIGEPPVVEDLLDPDASPVEGGGWTAEQLWDPLYLPEWVHNATQESFIRNARKAHQGTYTRVSTKLVAMLLDGGRATAHALRLLAVKSSLPCDHVMNVVDFEQNRDISHRSFEQGIARMVKTGVLIRDPNGGNASGGGSRYANETLLDPGSKAYLVVPDFLLKRKSKQHAFEVAMAIAVQLHKAAEPRSFRLDDLAKRIGIRSHTTAVKVVRALQSLGLIAVREAPGLPTLVAQSGYVFAPIDGVSKNGGDRFEGDSFGGAHRNRKTSKKQEDFKETENLPDNQMPPLPPDARGALGMGHGEADWKSLKPWRQANSVKLFQERSGDWFDPNAVSDRVEIMTPANWEFYLDHFANERVPGHLKTSDALAQAHLLARTLLLNDELAGEVSAFEVMIGIAWRIGIALNNGRQIHSLGFIAVALAGLVTNYNYSWARDYPSTLGNMAKQANDLAEWGIATLRRLDVSHDAGRLRAQYAKTQLWRMCQASTVGKIKRAIETKVPPPGRTIVGWVFFED